MGAPRQLRLLEHLKQPPDINGGQAIAFPPCVASSQSITSTHFSLYARRCGSCTHFSSLL